MGKETEEEVAPTKAEALVAEGKRRAKGKVKEQKAKKALAKKAEERDAKKAKEHKAQKLSRNVDKGPEAK